MSATTPSLRSTPSPPPLPRKRESGAGATERLTTDVLVIGGGLAGLWAAIRAREQGQCVLIVEKGFAGASGCSVFAGAVVLCLTPDDDLDTFIAEESQDADYLLDPEWAEFVVRDNYERLRGDRCLGRSDPGGRGRAAHPPPRPSPRAAYGRTGSFR